MSTNFTIGCDPEIFLVDKNTGKGFSAYGIIPGDKENPHKTERGAVQVDGMALEFNTDPVPLEDFETFNANIVAQLKQLRVMVPDNLSLRIAPTQEFDPEYLESQPDKAKELGCDPDWNAYTMKPNPAPEAKDAFFRTGAGHIHIGWGADIPVDNEEHIEICANFTKMMDATVGLLMAFLDRDPLRRELYGKAGAFRPKPYGVEYRTPSSVWIKNRDTRNLVHMATKKAISWSSMGFEVEKLMGLPASPEAIINNGMIDELCSSRYLTDSLFRNAPVWRRVKDRVAKEFEHENSRNA